MGEGQTKTLIIKPDEFNDYFVEYGPGGKFTTPISGALGIMLVAGMVRDKDNVRVGKITHLELKGEFLHKTLAFIVVERQSEKSEKCK